MTAPSFLDLAEEAPAVLGSEDIRGHSKAIVCFPIKALTVLMAKGKKKKKE